MPGIVRCPDEFDFNYEVCSYNLNSEIRILLFGKPCLKIICQSPKSFDMSYELIESQYFDIKNESLKNEIEKIFDKSINQKFDIGLYKYFFESFNEFPNIEKLKKHAEDHDDYFGGVVDLNKHIAICFLMHKNRKFNTLFGNFYTESITCTKQCDCYCEIRIMCLNENNDIDYYRSSNSSINGRETFNLLKNLFNRNGWQSCQETSVGTADINYNIKHEYRKFTHPKLGDSKILDIKTKKYKSVDGKFEFENLVKLDIKTNDRDTYLRLYQIINEKYNLILQTPENIDSFVKSNGHRVYITNNKKGEITVSEDFKNCNKFHIVVEEYYSFLYEFYNYIINRTENYNSYCCVCFNDSNKLIRCKCCDKFLCEECLLQCYSITICPNCKHEFTIFNLLSHGFINVIKRDRDEVITFITEEYKNIYKIHLKILESIKRLPILYQCIIKSLLRYQTKQIHKDPQSGLNSIQLKALFELVKKGGIDKYNIYSVNVFKFKISSNVENDILVDEFITWIIESMEVEDELLIYVPYYLYYCFVLHQSPRILEHLCDQWSLIIFLKTFYSERRKIHGKCEKCGGFIYSNYKCENCEQKYCNLCGKILINEHVCKEEDIKSWKLILETTTRCPRCCSCFSKMICSDYIYCQRCHVVFNYSTGQVYNGFLYSSVEENIEEISLEEYVLMNKVSHELVKDVLIDTHYKEEDHEECDHYQGYIKDYYMWKCLEIEPHNIIYPNILVTALYSFLKTKPLAVKKFIKVQHKNNTQNFNKYRYYDYFMDNMIILDETLNNKNIM